MVALAARYNLILDQMDVDVVFLNSNCDEIVYIELLLGWLIDGKEVDHGEFVALLNKALYGLKQSPRLWQKTLRKELQALGFEAL